MKIKSTLTILAILTLCLYSCDEEEEIFSPRPRGYFRIDLPKKEYKLYDSICPFKFEIPKYSNVEKDKHSGAEPCWLNIEFKQFKATMHLSYKALDKDLARHLENSHYFANKHQVKATGLDEVAILRDSAKVYGLLFDISGNTASALQFYLTDSTRHFLRGALYFNCKPNSDSLKIIVDYIREDLLHLINTTSWKNT